MDEYNNSDHQMVSTEMTYFDIIDFIFEKYIKPEYQKNKLESGNANF